MDAEELLQGLGLDPTLAQTLQIRLELPMVRIAIPPLADVSDVELGELVRKLAQCGYGIVVITIKSGKAQ